MNVKAITSAAVSFGAGYYSFSTYFLKRKSTLPASPPEKSNSIEEYPGLRALLNERCLGMVVGGTSKDLVKFVDENSTGNSFEWFRRVCSLENENDAIKFINTKAHETEFTKFVLESSKEDSLIQLAMDSELLDKCFQDISAEKIRSKDFQANVIESGLKAACNIVLDEEHKRLVSIFSKDFEENLFSWILLEHLCGTKTVELGGSFNFETKKRLGFMDALRMWSELGNSAENLSFLSFWEKHVEPHNLFQVEPTFSSTSLYFEKNREDLIALLEMNRLSVTPEVKHAFKEVNMLLNETYSFEKEKAYLRVDVKYLEQDKFELNLDAELLENRKKEVIAMETDSIESNDEKLKNKVILEKIEIWRRESSLSVRRAEIETREKKIVSRMNCIIAARNNEYGN